MNYHFDADAERAAAIRAMIEKAGAERLAYGARPFRFEDLNGKPEPESWGPKYSKPAKPAPAVDRWPSNCASGQKGDFNSAVHRAKIKAAFTATANADRRDWAQGKIKSKSIGQEGLTIRQAYARAMAEKRARLEALELPKAA